MKISNKTIAIMISMFFAISMLSSTVLVPNTQSAQTIPTFAYINVAPNPIGVGQQVSVIMWLNNVYDGALLANDYRFHNYQLTITKPDGTTEKETFEYVSDSTSSQFTTYVPEVTGTYTFNFSFPGQKVSDYSHSPTTTLLDATYLPSSKSTTLTVQEDQISTPIDSYPLPTEYWTRPIYGENPYWFTVSSNWLGTGSPGYGGFAQGGSGLSGSAQQLSFPGDAIGSLTNHVMWTKPYQFGGVVGGNNLEIAGDTWFEGSAYVQRYTNPIIVHGRLYYTESVSFGGAAGNFGGNSYGPTVCVDLRTGEELWSRNDVPALSFAYIYDVQDPNQAGVYPAILFSGGGGFFSFGPLTLRAFDAETGNPMFNITNVPTGATALGPNGEYLVYGFQTVGENTYLTQWNMSKLWHIQYSGASTVPSIIPPVTDGNWPGGYVPAGMFGMAYAPSLFDVNVSMGTIKNSPTVQYAYPGDIAICRNGTFPVSGSAATDYTYFAVNLNESKGIVGSILWRNTVSAPSQNVSLAIGPADRTANGGAGVFTEAYQQTMQWIGYSMATGAKLWGPTPSQNDFDYYGTPAVPVVQGVGAYGNLYSSGFGGIMYCYDMNNGNLKWTYGNGDEGNSTNAGLNLAEGRYPTFINAIGNGVVYTVTTEHTVQTPIYKGALARAINATDGSEIWTISGYTGEFGTTSYAMADGYNTWFNGYDNQIYVVGKGTSQTTVSAPNAAITLGNSLIISGTVTDTSSGASQDQVAKNFPNGLPVASDASMKDWMGYVYQQKPLPTIFTGVDVTVTVIDANGNYRVIGTTITDASGSYGIQWTPDIAGKYAVIATFAGTNGYWSSYAETYFAVDEAAATAAPQPTAAPSMADLYFLPMSIGIVVAIVIVGAIMVLMIRKHP
jgi:hypothetical protein